GNDNYEINIRSRRTSRLRGSDGLRSESLFRLSSWQQPAGVAESRISGRRGQVQEPSSALLPRGRTTGEPQRGAARAGATARVDRDTRCDRRRTKLEGRLVVGGQQSRWE